MVGERVLDDAEELFLGRGAADGQSVQELYHETGETFECAGDADGWVDFDENAFGGVDVDLELASLVDRGVEKGEETLVLVSMRPLLLEMVIALDVLCLVARRLCLCPSCA